MHRLLLASGAGKVFSCFVEIISCSVDLLCMYFRWQEKAVISLQLQYSGKDYIIQNLFGAFYLSPMLDLLLWCCVKTVLPPHLHSLPYNEE